MLLAVLLTTAVSCSDDDDAPVVPPQGDTPNLVEAAQAADLNLLLDAVNAVDGLGETLLAEDAITVFAPTDEAFGAALERFEAENLDELVAAIGGVENLEIVLGFHVVPAVAFSTDLAEGEQTFPTLAGDQEITVTRSGSSVTVTDSEGTTRNVVTADVEIENGVVHVINGVLIPELPEPQPTIADLAVGNDDLSSLVAALEYTGLDEVVADPSADLTVFAPTNAAFETFLNGAELTDLPVEAVTQVLLNHVLSGAQFSSDLETTYTNSLATYADTEDTYLSFYINTDDGVRINGVSSVTGADNEASNGVVHIVDAVIDLPTVVTFATADPNFNSLEAALTADGQPDFVATLSTQGEAPAPFTVFAPTNDAFDALLTELGASGLGDIPAATLTAALNSHVVAEANIRSTDLVAGPVTTLGAELQLSLDGETPTLTDPNGRESNIIVVDVQAANGVVHAIDRVVLPELE